MNKRQKFLVKPIFGSQGKNIILIKNINDLLKFKPLGNVFYVQNFIGSDKQKIFSDLRILVSNHKVLTSMERYSKNFITNVHQGANFKKKLKYRLTQKVDLLWDLTVFTNFEWKSGKSTKKASYIFVLIYINPI